MAEASGALLEPQAVLFDPFLSELEERTFRYFWETANPKNGLIPDRYPTPSFASIAAVGFGLTAYPIGAERNYITRAEARERVLATLRFFQHAPNQHGFFYHFLDMQSGARASDSEVSTVDTALLLAGMLFCQSYFDTQHPHEVQIRKLVDEIYRRVDWTWAQARPPVVALAWTPEGGFSGIDWQGYNEAMLVYLLALGSPTHAISPQAWDMWTSTYDKHWGTLYDQTYLSFGPLFGHQYTHVWVDFRGIRDAYMRSHGLDYFENSRRATYTQRRYAIANPKHWQAYGKNIWGISASDGPGGSERPSCSMPPVGSEWAASSTMVRSPRPRRSARSPSRRRSCCPRRSRCITATGHPFIQSTASSMRSTRASAPPRTGRVRPTRTCRIPRSGAPRRGTWAGSIRTMSASMRGRSSR
jgi:hypothetical protein